MEIYTDMRIGYHAKLIVFYSTNRVKKKYNLCTPCPFLLNNLSTLVALLCIILHYDYS